MITKAFRILYERLFKIDDTPQKIALGMGIGVFSGIFPGMGPIAALFVAVVLRANRASTLLGCLLTNTWLSVVTFILAIQAGSVILGVNWRNAQQDWNYFLKDFSWPHLFKFSLLKLIFPVVLGYLLIGIIIGVFTYFLTLIVIRAKKHK
jgi:uncharacterized protein